MSVAPLPQKRTSFASRLSPGAWTIAGLAVVSTITVLVLGKPERNGMPFWIFNKVHDTTYRPFVDQWNERHPEARVDLLLIHLEAYERRLLSGFTANTPIGDILEVERRVAARTFLGPEETVGFVDLKPRLEAEGLLDQINAPSFALWTSRGHIYGIPHDVHPMLLCYRSDIIEAAGIDLPSVETWDEFARVLRPLMKDFDGDGRPDRFPLAGWPTNLMFVESMLRQGGGAYFDADSRIVIDSEINARLLATITTWTSGPDRFCTDVPDQNAAGNEMRRNGTVLCQLMPDWMVGQWKRDLSELGGKVKLMPLPAFTPGGRRTSVWGGTMLGIARDVSDFETAWKFAKEVYLSPEVAEATFRGTGIITPVKTHWTLPVFSEPDPYFCGQPSGNLFIAEAPNVPIRSSSPFERLALERVVVAAIALRNYAVREETFGVEDLLPEARRLLEIAQSEVKLQMDRNVFINP